MEVLKLLCLAVFGVLWGILWTAHDEDAHLVESIEEGEFDMEQQVVSQEALGPSSFAIVYDDGTVTINDDGMRLIELSAEEAYNLLAVLYANEHILRQRADTVPLPEHAPDGSNYHDEKCRCPGCNYDGPEPTEEEGQRIMAEMGPEPVEAEQWQASGTCQIDEKHTNRDVFRCDGCKRLACNECGESIEDQWLCESCLAQEVAYLF